MSINKKLSQMSGNLVSLIENSLESQRLAKFIYYTSTAPMQEDVLVTKDLAPMGSKERILPYPFDIKYRDEKRSQLHIYFPHLQLKNNEHVEDTLVHFDIVVHKSLWLAIEGKSKVIRPYEIASEVAELNDKDCIFFDVDHVAVNEEFDAIRLSARIRDWNE